MAWGAGILACALACMGLLASAAGGAGVNPKAPHNPSLPGGPSLTIAAGSVKEDASKLKGSATAHNGGDPITRPVFVTLLIQLPGADHLLRRTHLNGLGGGASHTVNFNLAVPTGLPIGHHPIWACAGRSGALPAPSVANGCRTVGGVNVPVPRLPTAPAAPAPSTHTEAPSTTQSLPLSTVPTAPIAFEDEVPLLQADPAGNYWTDVPSSYDPTHQTPTKLLVWLHGCGGESAGDIYTVSPETVGPEKRPRDWISIAVGGREGECWDVNDDGPAVLAAIADVETHFNIDRHRVILGGYSSGGDLSYRLAFYDADQFAGVLAENTSPFRDTGSTQQASLAAAAWKFHVVHLAHLQDTEYPIAGVRQETDAMIAAGFPLERIELPGDHYNEVGEKPNIPGTDADLIHYLLPHIDDGWTSP
jgi:hypothetical protein